MAGVFVRVQGGGSAGGGMVTDSTGHYRIRGLEAGTYAVEALRVGYYTEQRMISYSSHFSMRGVPRIDIRAIPQLLHANS